MALDPEMPDAHFALGRLFLVGRSAEQAIEPLRRAAALEPGNAWYLLNLARAAERVGALVEALHALRSVVDLIQDRKHAFFREAEKSLDAIGWRAFSSSRSKLKAGAYHEAWPLMEVAAAAVPDSFPVEVLRVALVAGMYQQLADMYKANSPEVRNTATAFVKLQPDHQKGLLILAKILFKEREFRAALDVWEKLAELRPKDSRFHLQIARCCARLRMPEREVEAARAALAFDPSLEEAETIVRDGNSRQRASSRHRNDPSQIERSDDDRSDHR